MLLNTLTTTASSWMPLDLSQWQVWSLLPLTFLVMLIYHLHRINCYWSERGITGPWPFWFLGNLPQRLVSDMHQLELTYNHRYGSVYGTFFGTMPVLCVATAELATQALVTDFVHFTNRLQLQSYHDLWNRSLASANDQAWKRLRTITSRSFSSGRLKAMRSIMTHCVSQLDGHLSRLTSGESSAVIDVRHVMGVFTLQTFASTSFGIEVDVNHDPNNRLVANSRKLFNINAVKAAAIVLLPGWVLRLFGVETIFDPSTFNYFGDLTTHIVSERVAKGERGKRNDLMQLLLDAEVDQKDLELLNFGHMTATDEGEEEHAHLKDDNNNSLEVINSKSSESTTKRKLTQVEVVANCIFFMVGGYESTSATLTNVLFELASNQAIQERLANDLAKVLDRFGSPEQVEHAQMNDKEEGDYFDAVMTRLPYLEAVIKETLRRYAPLSVVSRHCATDGYMLGGVRLYRGQLISVGVHAIHMNPEYHPNPELFDPERFMPENRSKLVPGSYLPFSTGPRNCIALRFAYQEMKLCLSTLVRRYRFLPAEGTPKVLTFKRGYPLRIANPFPLRVERRR